VQRVLASALAASDQGAVDGCSCAASSSATPFRLLRFSLNQDALKIFGCDATLQTSS
jgi:hypothetical protein